MSNHLSLRRVDELFRHFEAALPLRGVSRETGADRKTVARYYRRWQAAARPREAAIGAKDHAVLLRISPTASAGLDRAARGLGLTRGDLGSRIIEAAVSLGLVETMVS